MSHDPAPLVVFSDDWGRHPSSTQHLVRPMLADRRVIWVNTIGTRRPRLTLADARRGCAKLRQWFSPSSAAAPAAHETHTDPVVLNPPMWPDFASPLARSLNTRLIARTLRRALAHHAPRQRPALLTTVPLMADLLDHLPFSRTVYCCVDDWSTWPRLDHPTLDTLERRLVQRVDHVVAVSDVLCGRMAALGREATLLTHGVDTVMWREPVASDHPSVQALAAMPGPLCVFWGLVDSRLDRRAIAALASQVKVVLIGPLGEGAAEVPAIPGMVHLDAVPHAHLPAVAQLADALILPYDAHHPALIASQPLKLMEYLATDKPVIATDLPAAAPWGDACDIVSGAQFASVVLRRLRCGAAPEQLAARAARLPAESWSRKSLELQRMLDEPAGMRLAS